MTDARDVTQRDIPLVLAHNERVGRLDERDRGEGAPLLAAREQPRAHDA